MNYKATIKHPEDLTRYSYTFNGKEWVSDGPRLLVSEEREVEEMNPIYALGCAVSVCLAVMALGYIVGMLLW